MLSSIWCKKTADEPATVTSASIQPRRNPGQRDFSSSRMLILTISIIEIDLKLSSCKNRNFVGCASAGVPIFNRHRQRSG
jgi:hypothetical protein